LQDPTTQALAATVEATLSSDQDQLNAYLATNKVKVNKLQLAADTDKTVDAQLQTAQQNNSLDDAYKTYLRADLAKYLSDLQAAYKNVGPKGQVILKNSFDSAKIILNSPPIKT
jgi:hypothetical protein